MAWKSQPGCCQAGIAWHSQAGMGGRNFFQLMYIVFEPCAGHFKCDNKVMVGRPANLDELARLVQVRT